MDTTTLLSVAEVAKMLDRTPDAVRAMERKGRLRAMRTRSGLRLFDPGDVLNLARERHAQSVPTPAGELLVRVLNDVLEKLPADRRAEAEQAFAERGLFL